MLTLLFPGFEITTPDAIIRPSVDGQATLARPRVIFWTVTTVDPTANVKKIPARTTARPIGRLVAAPSKSCAAR